MNSKSLKNKIVRNLPAIITVAAIGATVTVAMISIRKSFTVGVSDPFIDELNQKLADGTATMIQQDNGNISIFW